MTMILIELAPRAADQVLSSELMLRPMFFLRFTVSSAVRLPACPLLCTAVQLN